MARAFVPHVISRDSAIGGMDIPRSLRVDQGTSNVSAGSFFTRTFANSNKRTFTISVWFKKCYTVGNIGDDSYTIISCGGGGTGSYAGRFGFDSYSADQLQFVINNPAPTNHARARSTRRFRDDTWYHAVLAYDSTQATESDRMKMYINGELETMDSPSYPSQNYEGYFNNNVLHRVGATSSWSTGQDLGQFNGYLAEFHFIDGTAYDSSYFGYTEQQTGIWRPKRFEKSSIPNKKGRTFSGSGWTVSGGSGFSGSKPITNAYNGSIGTSNSDVANNSAGGAFLTWDTSAYNLTGNLRIFCWSDGGEYDIYVNGNSGSTTKVGDTPSGSGNAAWIDCGTFDHIKEIQLSGTTYNTDTGLGSSGVYIAGFMVNGTLLRDDMSEYGTNGFYLNFSDNTSDTTIGYDYSGNANHFSPHDVQVSDSVPDTPTNDFCMMTGLNGNYGLSHGNLQFWKWNDSSAALVTCQASMDIPNTGKWVWEHRWTGYQHTRYWAMTRRMRAQGAYLDNSAYVYYDMYNGETKSGLNGSVVTTLTGGQTSYGDNTTRFWMMACDMDAMQVSFYYNNTLISTIAIPELPDDGKGNYVWTWTSSNGGSGSTYDDRFNFGQDATYSGAASPPDKKDASGLGQFYTTVPDGHKCLCTKNLPPRTDVIVEPQKHFDTLLYTGTGSSNSVTGLKFAPDLIWAKRRDTNGHHHLWVDTIRGGSKSLQANTADSENSNANRDMTFLSNGIRWNSDTGNANANGGTYAVWCWKAGGAAVSNSDGAITSSVSVNDEAGFSIVSYSGNGNSTATIGHGLSKAPKLIITKCRSTSTQADWVVWHEGLSDNKNVYLNQSNAEGTPSYGHITDPTSTLINVSKGSGNQTNASGETYISYCWSEIPGYSKFGYYTGNGNSNGTNVVTGFKPAWLMVKKINTANSWVIFDTKRSTTNLVDDYLIAEGDDAEATSANVSVDFLSNGFKFRSGYDIVNAGDYVYMAFADQTSLNQYNLAVNGR